MSEVAPVMARNPLGRVIDGRLVVTDEDLHLARTRLDLFDNVFPGRGHETAAFGKVLRFNVAVALARGTGAVIILSRDSRSSAGAAVAGGIVGAAVRATNDALVIGKPSQRFDVTQISPDSVGWADDRTAVITVGGSAWRLTLDSIGRCCLWAWQATSYDAYRARAHFISGLPDPDLALLVHGVAKNTDPRTFLSWTPPYESVAAAIEGRLSDSAEWQRVCAVAGELDYRKDFCRNLARLPVPGSAEAAVAIARKFNRWNWTESAIVGGVGAAAAIAGVVRFHPLETTSLWGWGLLIGGTVLFGCGLYWLIAHHISAGARED